MKNQDLLQSFIKMKSLVFVLLLVLISGLATVAYATDPLNSLRAFWSNKLPNTTQLKNDYNNLRSKPFGREDLALSLLKPKNWRDIKVTVAAEKLENDSQNWIPVTTLLPPKEDKIDAAIEVAFIRLDLEMGLRDFIDQHVEANNYTVLLRRRGVFNKRKVEEVLVHINNQIARITFSRHGDRIFAVICSSPESEYQRYAQIFAAAAVSFTLKKESAQKFPSAMKNFSPKKKPGFTFKYPEHWEIKEAQGQPTGQSAVELRMMAPDDKGQMATYGYIYVQAYDKNIRKTPADILGDVRKTLEAKPMTFKDKILIGKLAAVEDDALLKLERYSATVKGIPAEAAILVIPRGSDLLALSLVVPTREQNLLAWMHCWRIFEIIANDLAGKELPIDQVKSLSLPSEKALALLVSDTMQDFAVAVKKRDFSQFYNHTSRLLQIQSTASRLRSAFSGFDRQPEIPLLGQQTPVFTGSYLDAEGLLKVEGYIPTKPKTAVFKLTYLYEKPQWKLLGINLAMRDKP